MPTSDRVDALGLPATPCPLPTGLGWASLQSPAAQVEAAALLGDHYVTGRHGHTRVVPGQDFLAWMWSTPGQPGDWLLGCREQEQGRLIGVITATPLQVRLQGEPRKLAQINFLCLHPDHRERQLTAALVTEISRRVVASGIRAALYMGPGLSGFQEPIARVPGVWWPLQSYRVLDAGLLRLQPERYRLPDGEPTSPLRPLRPSDLPAVQTFLAEQSADAALCPLPDGPTLAHWLLPRPGVVSSFVAGDGDGGPITEVTSVYLRDLAVAGRRRRLRVASSMVLLSSGRPLETLIADTLLLARQAGGDLLEAPLVGPAAAVLGTLPRFLPGPPLDYHLFNTQCPPLTGADIAISAPL